MRVEQIVIVGAGIGGLTAALALQRRGFRVAVYERASVLREIGAGVGIAPNARRALRDLGIDQELEALSSSLPVAYLCNFATGEISGTRFTRSTFEKQGMGTLLVHRADLHGLLMKAVLANDPQALHAGHEFARLDQDAEGVTASFANGVRARGDALIGADGNASAVRTFLFPGEAPRFNGQMSFRALIPDELVPPSIRERCWAMYPAPQRYLLHYPLRGGRIMNLIGTGRSATWEEEGWSIPATNEEFLAAYSDFAADVQALISAIPAGNLFKWGLRDREPLARWTVGRVTMLGDAAHPLTPFLGQGACIAIEDGLVLGRAFAASATVEEALSRYEAARRTRGTNVQIWSREAGEELQGAVRERTSEDRGLLDYDATSAPV